MLPKFVTAYLGLDETSYAVEHYDLRIDALANEGQVNCVEDPAPESLLEARLHIGSPTCLP